MTNTLSPRTFPKSVEAPNVETLAVPDVTCMKLAVVAVIWPVRAALAPMTFPKSVVAWTVSKLAVDPLRPAPVPIKFA